MALNAPTGGAPPSDIWQQILSIMQGSGGGGPVSSGDVLSSPGSQGGSPVPGVVAAATNPTMPASSGGVNSMGGAAGSGPSGGSGIWGNPATQDSVDAWFAKAVLAAQGNPTQLQHILASVTGPNGPQGSLYQHYYNMIKGVMAGDPAWISEAQHYATNPSAPANAGGDGIPNDGK